MNLKAVYKRIWDDCGDPLFKTVYVEFCCPEMERSWENREIGLWCKGAWPNDVEKAKVEPIFVCMLMDETMSDSYPYTVGRPIKKCPHCGETVIVEELGELEYREKEDCSDCALFESKEPWCDGHRSNYEAAVFGWDCPRWKSKTAGYLRVEDREKEKRLEMAAEEERILGFVSSSDGRIRRFFPDESNNY